MSWEKRSTGIFQATGGAAYDGRMAIGFGIIVVLIAIGACVWLGTTSLKQINVLRGELDQTQQQVNDTRRELEQTQQQVNDTRRELARTQRELDELKAAAEV